MLRGGELDAHFGAHGEAGQQRARQPQLGERGRVALHAVPRGPDLQHGAVLPGRRVRHLLGHRPPVSGEEPHLRQLGLARLAVLRPRLLTLLARLGAALRGVGGDAGQHPAQRLRLVPLHEPRAAVGEHELQAQLGFGRHAAHHGALRGLHSGGRSPAAAQAAQPAEGGAQPTPHGAGARRFRQERPEESGRHGLAPGGGAANGRSSCPPRGGNAPPLRCAVARVGGTAFLLAAACLALSSVPFARSYLLFRTKILRRTLHVPVMSGKGVDSAHQVQRGASCLCAPSAPGTWASCSFSARSKPSRATESHYKTVPVFLKRPEAIPLSL